MGYSLGVRRLTERTKREDLTEDDSDRLLDRLTFQSRPEVLSRVRVNDS